VKVLFVFFNHPATPFNSSVAALAGLVRDAGHEASALSIPLTSTVAEAAARVDAEPADVIAATAMTRDWPGARALLERIEPGRFHVVGGYHASLAPRDVARSAAVHAIGIGDGERPLRAVLEGVPTESRPGLWVRGPAGFEGDPPAADPEPDIGALPRWDYDVFGGVEAMLDTGINTFGPLVDRFLPTRASRGCPYRCAYCSAPTWGRVAGFAAAGSRNVRPVTSLCDELATLCDRYRPDGFELWDEHFPVDLAWLDALASEYPERVGLPFKVEMHPSAATRARLERLAAAGCVLFHCGVEAGDPVMRSQTLNRRTADETLVRVFEDARELGLATSASVMTALPGETYEQAHRTVELLERLRPDSFMWSTYMALPFTPLGDCAIEAWPEPARETLDDYPSPVTSLPSAMSAEERRQIHGELGTLQAHLVARAAERDPRRDAEARPRPIAIPGQAPSSPEDVSERVAPTLGWAPPASALGPAVRINHARWVDELLVLEIESSEIKPQEISIGPDDGSPAFTTRGQLRFAHRGHEAPAALLRALRHIAERLDGRSIGSLRDGGRSSDP